MDTGGRKCYKQLESGHNLPDIQKMSQNRLEIIKHILETLSTRLYEPIKRIWEEENVRYNWSVVIICPIYKKGAKTDCSNYMGIIPLDVVYKVIEGAKGGRVDIYLTGRIPRNDTNSTHVHEQKLNLKLLLIDFK